MMEEQHEIFINMAVNAWNIQIDRTTKLFNALTDDQLKTRSSAWEEQWNLLIGPYHCCA